MEPLKQMIQGMAEQSTPQLDSSKTALLVVDLVNDGNDENGFFKTKLGFDIALLQEIEPNVVSLVEESKKVGIPIVGVQAIYDFGYIPEPMRERFQAMGIKGGLAPKGTWGSDIIPKIRNLGLDLILVKSHYSAFAPGRTFGYRPGNSALEEYMRLPASDDVRLQGEGKKTMLDYFAEAQVKREEVDAHLNQNGVVGLNHYLRGKGIDTLIVVGASTHVCINSTIAGASERGYKIFEPTDAVASEGIPNEGYLRHFVYACNDGMFKAELTTAQKLIEKIRAGK